MSFRPEQVLIEVVVPFEPSSSVPRLHRRRHRSCLLDWSPRDRHSLSPLSTMALSPCAIDERALTADFACRRPTRAAKLFTVPVGVGVQVGSPRLSAIKGTISGAACHGPSTMSSILVGGIVSPDSPVCSRRECFGFTAVPDHQGHQAAARRRRLKLATPSMPGSGAVVARATSRGNPLAAARAIRSLDDRPRRRGSAVSAFI